VLVGGGGVVFHVTVMSFDTKDGSAVVSIGFGRGGISRCFREATLKGAVSVHAHVSPDSVLHVDTPVPSLPHRP
jgi:hypothetical protein